MSRLRAFTLIWSGGFVAWWLFAPLAVMLVAAISEFVADGRASLDLGDYLRVVLPWSEFDEDHVLLLVIAAFTASLQLLLAVPAVPPYAAAEEGRSMRQSVVAAAVLAGALTVSLLFGGVEFIAFAAQEITGVDGYLLTVGHRTHEILAAAGLAWLVVSCLWTLVLWRVGRRSSPDAVERMVRRAFAASALQVVLGLPLFALVRRKESCWCALNTFWSICIGLTSMLLLCGPGVVLLLTRAQRRAWRSGACGSCGHLRAPGEVRCPECGAEHPMVPGTQG